MASLGIGETFRRERQRQGISLDDIARTTRIQQRFLNAIEAEDFDALPGLIFTRSFVKQYAEALRLEAEPILTRLPKPDESTLRLPDPPKHARKRTPYSPPGSRFTTMVWSVLAIASGIVLYTHFNPVARIRADVAAFRSTPASESQPEETVDANAALPEKSDAAPAPAGAPASSVQVVVTAVQEAWVQLSADGKPSFTGTLMPHEKKEISAVEQVKLVAGNAGGLTILLNGKPLEPIGPVGQVRVVRLTAEGPQFLPASPQPAPDPL